MAKTGRKSKYKKKYCKELINHFDIPAVNPETGKANDLPTITGFARKIGVSRASLDRWKHSFPEFRDALLKAKEIQEDIWLKNSLRGRYNTPFTIFMGKNVFGWTDKRDVKHTLTIEDRLKTMLERRKAKEIGQNVPEAKVIKE
jgi:hypothetical protein